MKLDAKIIQHRDQRYETVGDYWTDRSGLHFRVSALGNPDMEFLVLVHELIEEHMTRRAGIREEDIKAFDEMYEEERAKGLHSIEDEPGHDPRAPYAREHLLATGIEYALAAVLNVNLSEYNERVNALTQ